ncbi:hypothetical protein EDB19DRAFT_2029182 [Suillus lakei]|nr:hypothetical protein EDB19DRAFT_2029182 [Suillus lakei]
MGLYPWLLFPLPPAFASPLLSTRGPPQQSDCYRLSRRKSSCGDVADTYWHLAAYAFLLLLLPHAILAVTYHTPSPSNDININKPAPIAPPPSSDSRSHRRVLLMLSSCDVYDLLSRLTPHLIHRYLAGPNAHPPLIPPVTADPTSNPAPAVILCPVDMDASIHARADLSLLRVATKLYWIDDEKADIVGAEIREVELWDNWRWTPGPSSSSSFGSMTLMLQF